MTHRESPKAGDLYKTDLERHLFGMGADRRSQKPDSDIADAIHELIAKLPKLYHDVVKLRVIEGLRHVDIAERLEVPLGTVKSRLHRARKALREFLDELDNGRETPDESKPSSAD
ncbi:MAG: sigma-70 family RNA polymerase sigma factor [Gemmatimonadetes bacterium]|nr:sigma-70 family RNA polymerase sigma factor [Gemmatimonadota bacterium]